MRFRILGPVEIRAGQPESWQGIGAPKWRALLAVLLAQRGQVVSVDRLVDEIWGDQPPARARKLVNLYVLRLRRLLGDQPGELLRTRPPGYLLCCGPGDVDAGVFQAMVAAGRRELEAQRADKAAELLSRALRLWRGAVFADVAAGTLVSTQAGSLAEARLDALQLRIEADLRCHRNDALVTELRGLVAEHPLREKFWALLLRALAGAGRRAEALDAYAQARRVIGEELGTEPGEELRDLHKLLLAGDGAAAPPPAAHPVPAPPAAAPPGGREGHTADSVPAGGEQALLPGEPVCQLPPDVADFTGRLAECAGLRRLLAAADGGTAVPVAVLSGQPGIGKTTLALHVAHVLRTDFPDGQLFVPLAGATPRPREPGEVLGELLRALGVPSAAIPATTEQRTALFRSRLAGRNVLVVADDAASLEQVRPLLPGTVGCAMIVTSRARLAGLAGARLFPLECLRYGDAVDMLARIAGPGRVAAEPDAAAGLVTACGRLPLAVRIAGSRLAGRPSWPVAKVAKLVGDERRRLDELAVDDLAVRASVASSYETLDQRSRVAFRRLGLLGPHDVAAWVVAALLGEPSADDVIDVLVDRSLLSPMGIDATGEPRYRLHDLLRHYAAERMAQEPKRDADAALGRVLARYVEFAHLADENLPSLSLFPPPPRVSRTVTADDSAARLTADPIAWFTAERLNVLAAVKWACAIAQLDAAAELASCQFAFQYFQNRADDLEQMWRVVVGAAEAAGDATLIALCELGLGCASAFRGQHADALETLGRCVRAFDDLGCTRPLATALYWRSFCADAQELVEIGRQYAERCLKVARQCGDRRTEMLGLRMLGIELTRLGQPETGIPLCDQALTIARELKAPALEHMALTSAAYAAIRAGKYELGGRYCLELAGVTRDLSVFATGEAYYLGLLSDTYYGRGRYQEAIEALSRALPAFRVHGDRRGLALCLLKLGYAHLALGERERAIGYLERCVPIFDELRQLSYANQANRLLAECRSGGATGTGWSRLVPDH